MIETVLDIGLPAGIFLVMFWLGLELRLDDFAQVLQRPRLYLMGLFLQSISLPVIALAILLLWPAIISDALAMGVMLLAAAPGGITSNVFTRLARGDTALSISLTATMALASVVTIPVILVFSRHILGIEDTGAASVFSLSVGLFAIVALPVGLGVLCRSRFSGALARVEPAARRIAILLIASLLLLALLEDVDALRRTLEDAAFLVVTLNIVTMAVAFLAGKSAGAGRPQLTAIVLECGLQSTPVAITLVVLLDLPTEALSPAAIYGVSMLIMASTFTFIRANAAKQEPQTGPSSG
ncbi:bile acid:sodium symporter family protein [Roseovarius sp.]|uniref:bile acid:sodium symporter family protein n=1 Tax=Roseovarius sp. TaxID=1486281 RepID=UPI00356973F2